MPWEVVSRDCAVIPSRRGFSCKTRPHDLAEVEDRDGAKGSKGNKGLCNVKGCQENTCTSPDPRARSSFLCCVRPSQSTVFLPEAGRHFEVSVGSLAALTQVQRKINVATTRITWSDNVCCTDFLYLALMRLHLQKLTHLFTSSCRERASPEHARYSLNMPLTAADLSLGNVGLDLSSTRTLPAER